MSDIKRAETTIQLVRIAESDPDVRKVLIRMDRDLEKAKRKLIEGRRRAANSYAEQRTRRK